MLKDNRRLHIKKFFRELIKSIIKTINIKNVLGLFELSKSKKVIMLIPIVLMGTTINYTASHPLPYFGILLIMLVLCIIASYYTTHKILICQKNFNKEMSGDYTLLKLRTEYIANSSRYSIYIPIIFFGIIVPTAAFLMIGIKINPFVNLFCFWGLSCTVMICTFGAIQYLILLLFIHKIRINIKNIKNYENLDPQQTEWFQTLFNIIRICNTLFLLVGLIFVIAFCLFTFSERFAIDFSNTGSKICLWLFWAIIVIFIIFGAVFFTISSNIEIKKILNGLYDNEQTTLNDNFSHARDEYIKNLFSIQLSLMVIKRNTKILFKKNIFSYLLSVIDAIASLEATLSFLGMMLHIELPNLFDFITNNLTSIR